MMASMWDNVGKTRMEAEKEIRKTPSVFKANVCAHLGFFFNKGRETQM